MTKVFNKHHRQDGRGKELFLLVIVTFGLGVAFGLYIGHGSRETLRGEILRLEQQVTDLKRLTGGGHAT